MSHTEHQAICVTSWSREKLEECHKRIKSIGLNVTDMTCIVINDCSSFFVAPCGSKAGWPEAAAHLCLIDKAVEIINSFAYEDGSNCIEFHLSVYGDHEG